MRPGLHLRRTLVLAVGVFSLLSSWNVTTACAQKGIAREGAIFLLLPLGAKTVASGQSVAIGEPGSEQLLWNPAGIAHATHGEFGFNYGKFFVGPLVSINMVKPLGRAGVIGAIAGVLDYGTQDNTDITNGVRGTTSQQNYVLGASYAATLGRHASIGLTFKSAQLVANCSGICTDLAQFHVSASAVDVGAQYRMLKDDDLVLAIAVRHVGQRFQVNDEPQADPMPSRIQAGVGYRLHAFDNDLQGGKVFLTADVIDRLLEPGSAAPRFGMRVDWNEQIGVRAGYVAGSGEGTGIGVGVGFFVGHVGVDVAQTLGGQSGVTDGTSYLSVRYRW